MLERRETNKRSNRIDDMTPEEEKQNRETQTPQWFANANSRSSPQSTNGKKKAQKEKQPMKIPTFCKLKLRESRNGRRTGKEVERRKTPIVDIKPNYPRKNIPRPNTPHTT
jgi:hypothetical protein